MTPLDTSRSAVTTPTTFDFGWGPVPAHRHVNKDGSPGGWVAETARVSGDARVYGNALVYGDARVYGNARVSGDARVHGNARVSGDARVHGNARVSFGTLLAYPWTAYREKDGTLILHYGCERHPVAKWTPKDIAARCKQHVPSHAAQYAKALRALVALVKASIAPLKKEGK